MEATSVYLVWFRKGLRIHDNPALAYAINEAKKVPRGIVLPIFILDPYFVNHSDIGINRWNFMLQCLTDLNESLTNIGSRLFVFRGEPMNVFSTLFTNFPSTLSSLHSSIAIELLCFESDTEPYSKIRDDKMNNLCLSADVGFRSLLGHTLFDPKQVIKLNGGSVPLTYQSFCKNISKIKIAPVIETPVKNSLGESRLLNHVLDYMRKNQGHLAGVNGDFSIPDLIEIGKNPAEITCTKHLGGESEGLQRMERFLLNTGAVCKFEKPLTSPAAFDPASTTTLSPYLKMGALSVKLFYHKLLEVYSKGSSHTSPPVSLLGQIYWREFYYTCGYGIENYDRMIGNSICKKINWRLSGPMDKESDIDKKALEDLSKWENSETGFPWIDAIMTQLREEGWIHHLARHSVACFLTRGDLYISWERGAKIFDKLLIDADWSLNNGNWMWLSASAFFHQYYRVYSPIAFPKKYDPNGDYVRRYVPILKNMPAKYIYEPWKAPKSEQVKANCIIGIDYPGPMVDHETIMKENIGKMKEAYASSKTSDKTSVKNIVQDKDLERKRKRKE